jgi:hypothetical protein
VVFKGIAYPSSIVTLLKNGVILVELPANPNGTFEIKVKDLPSGTYSFAIRAEDGQHNRSALDLYTVYVTPGVSTVVDGIFIPPTITTDKVEVKQGDPIIISGNSAPSALLTISIHSGADLLKKIASNTSGFWSYKLDSSELDLGEHETRAKASTGTNLSLFSDTIKFIVGTKNRQRTASSKIVSSNKKCDINNDGRVNLLDFSIMAFWYKRTGFPTKVDLNADNRVDLSDVSILAFCWTG